MGTTPVPETSFSFSLVLILRRVPIRISASADVVPDVCKVLLLVNAVKWALLLLLLFALVEVAAAVIAVSFAVVVVVLACFVVGLPLHLPLPHLDGCNGSGLRKIGKCASANSAINIDVFTYEEETIVYCLPYGSTVQTLLKSHCLNANVN